MLSQLLSGSLKEKAKKKQKVKILFVSLGRCRCNALAGLRLLYHPPLAAASCITAVSVTDQYNAGELNWPQRAP